MTVAAHPYRMNPKHLDRYESELARRRNIRDKHTNEQLRLPVDGMTFEPLKYADLIPSNGLDNGASSS